MDSYIRSQAWLFDMFVGLFVFGFAVWNLLNAALLSNFSAAGVGSSLVDLSSIQATKTCLRRTVGKAVTSRQLIGFVVKRHAKCKQIHISPTTPKTVQKASFVQHNIPDCIYLCFSTIILYSE